MCNVDMPRGGKIPNEYRGPTRHIGRQYGRGRTQAHRPPCFAILRDVSLVCARHLRMAKESFYSDAFGSFKDIQING